MSTKTIPENWEKVYVELYGPGSLDSYKEWTCIKCGADYNAILKEGECPECHYQSILSNFFKRTRDAVVKEALKE